MCNLILMIALFASVSYNGYQAVRRSKLAQEARFARRLAQEMLDRVNQIKPRRGKDGRFTKKGAQP
jgi:hypothetical protein